MNNNKIVKDMLGEDIFPGDYLVMADNRLRLVIGQVLKFTDRGLKLTYKFSRMYWRNDPVTNTGGWMFDVNDICCYPRTYEVNKFLKVTQKEYDIYNERIKTAASHE